MDQNDEDKIDLDAITIDANKQKYNGIVFVILKRPKDAIKVINAQTESYVVWML